MRTNKGETMRGMVKDLPLGLEGALKQTLDRLAPLPAEQVALMEAVDRVGVEALYARVDSPSVDASLKDGYAVVSADLANATAEEPARLRLAGHAAAGGQGNIQVESGATVRVLTGARIPPGADAVLSEEFARAEGETVLCYNTAEPGRNILPRGSDVSTAQPIVQEGQRLTPGMVGLLAAGGHSHIPVVRQPRVAIVATGDEVVAPGQPLPEGKLYASNITTLGAWCRRYRMIARMTTVRDDPQAIYTALSELAEQSDALITSGGAWTGDRDLVARVLEDLGWDQVFHRIRIGPGKAVGFGMLGEKAVFILPGGPPSNLMGFLQIALPGLLRLGGYRSPGLPTATVRLAGDLRGRHAHWTQFIFGMVEPQPQGLPLFHSLKGESRLRSMAEAGAVVAIEEGRTLLSAGSVVSAQVLE